MACFSTRKKKNFNSNSSPIRRYVESLQSCLAEDVKVQVPVACSYDCAFSKPLRSRCLLRLQATVSELAGARPLTAPLTAQECVLYSATVSKRARGQGLALSFAAANVDFKLRLLDDPSTEIEVMGMDVSLFDMCQGRFMQTGTFGTAPHHWREFVMNNQVESLPDGKLSSSDLCTENASLEFEESALLIGSNINIVGELCRDPSGSLILQPLQPPKRQEPIDAYEDAPAGQGKKTAQSHDPSTSFRKTILASDDPNLLDTTSTSDDSESDSATREESEEGSAEELPVGGARAATQKLMSSDAGVIDLPIF
jgi:hypothetical protein